jgi:hypothetical protein
LQLREGRRPTTLGSGKVVPHCTLQLISFGKE